MEANEKKLIFKLAALAVITSAILITWSYLKKDQIELAENLIAALAAIVWLTVYFFRLYKLENL